MSNFKNNIDDTILNPVFWQKLSPNLTVSDNLKSYVFELSKNEKQVHHKNILQEGYTHLIDPGLEAPFSDITNTFNSITSLGLPPVFSFAYNELWELRTQLRGILSHLLNDEYQQLPDFWAWKVTAGEAGWPPHRDKSTVALLPDNKPKSVTVWIPLNQASPLNSCMYVLPADRDKAYYLPNTPGGGLPGKLNDIRALPANPGDILIWNQNLLHWGSHSASNHNLKPRMNIAFEFQRSDVPAFNKPLLNPHTLPSFQQRLALIARQVLQYTHMYKYTDELVSISREIETRCNLSE